ncbi:hypothetical protein [Geodermatophilus sp. DSM 44513]|uniref:hypothetical protein n=1 Tax=Geodermatophilus sp. DSM 44513 TaxID=1528104 RepID=UPI0012883C73|nr:hypothetical protein [Geodermatophilus sp. DSM 44513]WNV76732.1 hypothetical protein RTG05_05515 [Geodermatophilus sp. DSM 44513]
MTHSIDSPFPPPPSPGSGASSGSTTVTATTTGTTTTGSPSTSDVAKDEARNVGQTAAQAGSQVASTATDQAKQVAQETKHQAQDLVQQGRQQLRQQVTSQQHKAAEGLQGVVTQLRGMANGEAAAPGPVRDLLEQATGYVEQFADRLQNREPADLLDDVRAFARRRPGAFLLGAALTGVLAGRLTSGVKAAHTDGSSTSGGQQYRSSYADTNYVDPAPAYSGYGTATTGYEPTTGYETTTGYSGTAATGTPVPPPPYGTTAPAGAVVPPTTPAGWDESTSRPGQGV